MSKERRLNCGLRRFLALCVVTIGVLFALCGGALSQSIDFSIKQLTPVVITGTSPPLAPLSDFDFHSFPDGYRVNTDANGEALLEAPVGGTGCSAAQVCRVYVFQLSGLLKRGCPKSSFTGGNLACVEEGSAAFSKCSDLLMLTPSGYVKLAGSWISVTYLPRIQLTLILVLEGAVDVQPVLNPEEYTLGVETIRVDEGEFLFTAPDDQPQVIADLPGRQAVPFEELPRVIGELIIVEPSLERWLERIRLRAEEDGVQFPEVGTVPPSSEVEGLVLTVGGDLWDNDSVRSAVLHAVDWGALTESAFDKAVPVAVQQVDPSGQDIDFHPDARTYSYDPELAQKLLEEAGLGDGLAVELRLSPDDESVVRMAERMREDLAKVGILVQVTSTTGDVPAPGIAPVPRGQLVLQLTRQ